LTDVERRGAVRLTYAGGHLPPAARIRPGRAVTIVNLSSRGALIEGTWRLKPGSRVAFLVQPARETLMVEARVLRCFVARLDRQAPVRYRAALAFERSIPVPPRQSLLQGYQTHTLPKASGEMG
jgi:hypothetical protein